MLRLTEVKLPLDHPESEIKTAILKKLQIPSEALINYSIFKRSYDARKKEEIVLVYILDVETTHEKSLLQRLKKDPHVRVTPSMSYTPVAQAPEHLSNSPDRDWHGALWVVCSVDVGANGVLPDRARTRKNRQRAHRRHLWVLAKKRL